MNDSVETARPSVAWAAKYADFLETLLPGMRQLEVRVGENSMNTETGVQAAELNILALRGYAECMVAIANALDDIDSEPGKLTAATLRDFRKIASLVDTSLVTSEETITEAQPALPPNLNPDLIKILGRPNFMCGQIARILRSSGENILTKAEDEQAATIWFLLRHYMSDPTNWEQHAEAELESLWRADAAEKEA